MGLPTSSHTKASQYTKQLTDEGAVQLDLTSSALTKDELSQITHIIATDCNFEAYYDAVDALIPVVTPRWIENAVQKRKAPNPRTFSPDPTLYFNDVVVTFTEDIPVGDKDAIIGGIQALGGQYSEPLTKLVTHIVALSMHNHKCEVIQANHKVKAVAVLPHWFDHCLRLGRKIVEKPYILPHPPLLVQHDINDRPVPFKQLVRLSGSMTIQPQGEPTPSPDADAARCSIFTNRKLMLHGDLDLSERLKQSLTSIIVDNGGRVVEDVNEAEWLICHYRDSEAYLQASRASKDVGNLNWLYHLINRNTYASPMSRLLHYPYLRGGIEGFANAKITISNYTGEARIFLDSLVQAAGGEFTKTMTQENRYLITAHMAGDKCEAAQEWDIEIVNHLWLEESYAKGRMLPLANNRYNFFPERTNLTELVGQTPIDRKALRLSLGMNTEDSNGTSSQLSSHATPSAKAHANNESKRAARTPTVARLDQENIAPGSRSAKDRAISKLHNLAPDIAAYEKEKKRVGGVVYGGRRVKDADRGHSGNTGNGRKRSIDEVSTEPGEIEEDELVNDVPTAKTGSLKTKKQKRNSMTKDTSRRTTGTERDDVDVTRSSHPEYPPLVVLATGLDWDKHKEIDPAQDIWQDLNIDFVDGLDARPDVIVAKGVVRTPKFLVGLANAPIVSTSEWLVAMVKQKQRLPPEQFLLEDSKWEKEQQQRLSDILRRAQENKDRGGLMHDCNIYYTPNVKGGAKSFPPIVQANGGKALPWGERGTKIVGAKGKEEEDEDDDGDADGDKDIDGPFAKPNLHLVTEDSDKSMWKRFKTQAKEAGFVPHIRRSDWLLSMMVLQDANVPVKDEWELKDGV